MSGKRRKGTARGASVAKKGQLKAAGKARKEKKNLPEYVGTARMSRDGFIFVDVEGLQEDIFVKASKTRGAVFWEGQAPIVKRGSSKTVNW